MIVTIIPIEDNEKYNVNGKIVTQHSAFGWMGNFELSNTEREAFCKYKELIIENDRFKRHPKSTYKTH